MRSSLRLVGICAVILCCAATAGADDPATQPAKPDSTKLQDIRTLLQLSGSAKIGAQVAGQLMTQFRTIFPQVPPEFWDKMKDQINPEEMMELVVPIYDKHFTEEDIQGMIAFYRSPVGQKLTSELPQITTESMAAGQEWGRALAHHVTEQLKKDGYLKT